jgi:predicted aldo/keto reductase-like oxidoreductase
MNYRKFGQLDWQASALGFGCGRLPRLDGVYENIDQPEAIGMLRHAIDQGVNYLDTAYNYAGGNSERVVGLALQDGYRDRVKLVTKLFWPEVKTPDDFDGMLNEQLKRLQTDHVDLYLLHGMSGHPDSWPRLRDWGVLDWAEGAIADGRIGRLGFSFHDCYDVFVEIVDAYDNWAICQIQYNYMDVDNQAGTRGLQYAASKGLAVVIMEPLLGGALANPPDAVRAVWDAAPGERTPVDWALHWLWDQPEVSVVLSGMSTMEQVEQNVASASASAVGSFSEAEHALISRVREAYRSYCAIPCTECRYCMPCPNGVDIPRNFYEYNYGVLHDNVGFPRFRYNNFMTEDTRASECIQCRECEPKCTQQIPISEWMPVVHAVLGEGKGYEEVDAPMTPSGECT